MRTKCAATGAQPCKVQVPRVTWSAIKVLLRFGAYIHNCGADVAAAGEDGWSALHTAVFNGHCDAAKLLLERGADVAVAEKNGWTALYPAAQTGQPEAARPPS